MSNMKKRIGITQKVMKHPHYNETMECLDKNWTEFLTELGILPIPLPVVSTELIAEQWQLLKLDGLILSGGNTLKEYADDQDLEENISQERDAYELALLKTATSTSTPILGVCRGMQVINVYYGGKLIKRRGHSGIRHALISENEDNHLFLPAEVNSFHDCFISPQEIGEDLFPLAYDENGYIEAFNHRKNNILAIMWHPEREFPTSNEDYKTIKKFFKA